MTRADRTAQRLSKHLFAVIEGAALTAAAAATGDVRLTRTRAEQTFAAASQLADALAAIKERGYWARPIRTALKDNSGIPAPRGRKRAA